MLKILDSMDLKLQNEPMNLFHKNENDISDPYGKMTCLILYLYSMQIGEPPLYSEVNRVCRNMDRKYLKTLGPFIRCLEKTLLWAEKNAIDKRSTGDSLRLLTNRGGLHNMSALFILFSGAQLKQQWLYEYEKRRFEFVTMPGNFSCTENLGVAFEFAFKSE